MSSCLPLSLQQACPLTLVLLTLCRVWACSSCCSASSSSLTVSCSLWETFVALLKVVLHRAPRLKPRSSSSAPPSLVPTSSRSSSCRDSRSLSERERRCCSSRERRSCGGPFASFSASCSCSSGFVVLCASQSHSSTLLQSLTFFALFSSPSHSGRSLVSVLRPSGSSTSSGSSISLRLTTARLSPAHLFLTTLSPFNPIRRDFFPVILNFMRQLPVIGSFLSLPYIRGVRRPPSQPCPRLRTQNSSLPSRFAALFPRRQVVDRIVGVRSAV